MRQSRLVSRPPLEQDILLNLWIEAGFRGVTRLGNKTVDAIARKHGGGHREIAALLAYEFLKQTTPARIELCAIAGLRFNAPGPQIAVEKAATIRTDTRPAVTIDTIYDRAMRAWNVMAMRTGLSKTRCAGSERLRLIGTYARQEPDFGKLLCEACESIGDWTPFLIGENDTSWRATFDWLLAKRVKKASPNWQRVLEGEFGVAPNRAPDEEQARQRDDAIAEQSGARKALAEAAGAEDNVPVISEDAIPEQPKYPAWMSVED